MHVCLFAHTLLTGTHKPIYSQARGTRTPCTPLALNSLPWGCLDHVSVHKVIQPIYLTYLGCMNENIQYMSS